MTGSSATSPARTRRAPASPPWCCAASSGDISVTRSDGRLATLSSPNAPDRPVALKRRDLDELLSEELRRLDPDDVYAATVKRMARTGSRAAPIRTAKKG